MTYYQPDGFPLRIFQSRHALHPEETWFEGCERVGHHIATAESGTNFAKYKETFTDLLKTNRFMPGGRIWYGSGRPKGQLLNCFVVPTADSREGWGRSTSDLMIISGTGGGVGFNFSPVRPRNSLIAGTGGTSTGSVSLMRIKNAVGEELKGGGGRRVAMMHALSLSHPDLEEFLDAKLDKAQLNNANVSIILDDNPEDFFKLVRGDQDFELVYGGKVAKKLSAKSIWDRIIQNALTGGEPGLLNGYLANRMNNVWYCAPLICTNPCFAPETLVQTRGGHFPIESLVGKTVEVFDGLSWVSCSNFRVTGTDQSMLRIEMEDGSYERVTPLHSCILEDGSRVQAQDLQPGMCLKVSEAPRTHGTHDEPGAYLKGFLVGDGTWNADDQRPSLPVSFTKYGCLPRLVSSALEIPIQSLNTNTNSAVEFGAEDNSRRRNMTGLTARGVHSWVKEKSRIPVEVFAWSLKSKVEFIAGAMDADGSSSDTEKGWAYQISSIQKDWLYDFQKLLKTIGVASKLGLMKSAGSKDFGLRGGVCETQDCWRLTIAQAASIVLAKQVKFSRLLSFADREVVHKFPSRANRIATISAGGFEKKVYCCTIPTTHSFTLSTGIHWGQCGEIWLPAYDCCDLGALVLPRFVRGTTLDWSALKETVTLAVRFLDDVLTVNQYPLQEIKETCSGLRRIGLGVMGLSTMLLRLGMRYGSPSSLEFVDGLMHKIKNYTYEASIELAKEKGPFPKFDADKFLLSGFCKTLKPSIRAKIREHGIRGCANLTIAPTGTGAMICNVDGGIEPAMGPGWIRKYRDGDELRSEIVVHPLYKEMIDARQNVAHFHSSYDLTMRDHFEMQRVCQKHLDNACSKTINLRPGTSASELSDLYMEFLPDLKGITVYPEGSREDQPITPLSRIEIDQHMTEATTDGGIRDDCASGACSI